MTRLEKIDKELVKAREKAAEWQAKVSTQAELLAFLDNPKVSPSGQVGPESIPNKEDNAHEE